MIAGYTQARTRNARAALSLTCAALFAGCGNVTAGGYGDVEVYASGDAEEPAPASSFEPQSGPQGAPASETNPARAELIGPLEGDVTLEMTLFVRQTGGAEFELTPPGGVEVTLDLAGTQTSSVTQRLVRSGSFDVLRARFTRVSADVLGGLVIDGLPFIGAVDVDIDAAGLDVELPVSFVLEDDGSVELLLDVNTRVWLLTLTLDILDPLTATVTEQAFADALEASLR